MDESPITESPTTASHSDAVQEHMTQVIIASLLSALPDTLRGPVAQCSACAGFLGAFVESVKTHVPVVRPTSLTSQKQESESSADQTEETAESQ